MTTPIWLMDYDPAEDIETVVTGGVRAVDPTLEAMRRLVLWQQKTIEELSRWAMRVESGNRYQRASEKKGASK